MTEQEANELLRSRIINKKLLSLKVHNHHQPYPFIENNEAVVVSASVGLSFEDSTVTFFWHQEDHIFNFSLEPIEVMEDWDDIEITNIDTYQNLENINVEDIETNWTYFQRLDENFEIIEDKLFVPQELILMFSNGSKLQIACVDFNIDPVSSNLTNLSYNMNTGLLVSPVPYGGIAPPEAHDI